MKRTLITIDPGLKGAIAWQDDVGVRVCNMPDGVAGLVDQLRLLAAMFPNAVAVVEKVGTGMPGNSSKSVSTFARHCGRIDAALYSVGIPLDDEPTPAQWMRVVGVPAKMDKADRKRWIKDKVARAYPYISVTLNNADALGMMLYALNRSQDAAGGA